VCAAGDDVVPGVDEARTREIAEPARTTAITAAASIAMRRVAGRYHHGSNESATTAMSVVIIT
jgi:hypothetical protein